MLAVEVSIRGQNAAESDRLTADLVRFLEIDGNPAIVKRQQPDDPTLGVEPVVVVAVGTAFLNGLTMLLAMWSFRNRGADMTVKCGDREVSLKNVDVETAERLVTKVLSA